MKADDLPGVGDMPYFCEECGFKISEEKGDCSNCGARINIFEGVDTEQAA